MIYEELEKTQIINEHGSFFPSFEEKELLDENGNPYTDYTITITSVEKYEEYLKQNSEKILTDKEYMTLLINENKKLWDSVEYLFKQVDNGIPK